MKKEYRNFGKAREFVQSLKLKSQKDWGEYLKSVKRPDDIPTHPSRVYKNKGWKSFGDWLGTGTIASFLMEFLSFTEARKHVHTLGLKNNAEWIQYARSSSRPDNIPSSPNMTYKNKGWKSIPDWLGNGNLSNKNRTYLTYEKCQNIIQKLGITTQTDWEKYCKLGNRPDNIPAHPERIYKKEWNGWGNWLGTGRVANQNTLFWSYEKSLKYIHLQKFKNQAGFRKAAMDDKLPKGIPKSPMTIYKNKGWKGMGVWLGTGRVATQTISKNYLPFTESREIVRQLAKKYHLKTFDDWIKAYREGKIPKNIPLEPSRVYSKKRKK